MNYITSILLEIMEERFINQKDYLKDIKRQFKAHKNKYDGLNYLIVFGDKTTQKMFIQKTEVTFEDLENLKSMWWKI